MYSVGDTFLTQADQLRINTQQFYEDLYLSEHVYDKTVRVTDSKGNTKNIKVSQLLPMPQTISETWSDLLFMEFPKITFEDEQADASIAEIKDKLQIDLLEAAATCSAIGMLWWVLFNVDGKTHWKFIQPQHTKWTKNKLGELISFKIFHEMPKVDKNDMKKIYKVIEHTYAANDEGEIILDEQGRKTHVIFEYVIIVEKDKEDEWTVKAIQDVQEPDITDLDFIPAIQVYNMDMLGSDEGRSDYQGKTDLFKEIDNRYAQINYVINENADPWVLMPPGVLNDNGHFMRRNGKMIEKAASAAADNTVDIVTWNGELGSAFEAIKSMMRQLFFSCRLSPSIVGLEDGGSATDSGRALKWRSVNTLTALGKRRLYWGNAFNQFFEMIAVMDERFSSLEGRELMISWQDGLPIDITERTQVIVQQVNAGLKSRETAIRELNEVNKEDAQEEIERIDADSRTQAEIAASSMPSINV